MRILHTADWHLGKRLDSFSRHEEQVATLNEICAVADREKVDVVVIAGDLFDNFNPSNESIELFFKICKQLTVNTEGVNRAVIAIAGNHDSPERIEAPDPLARACGIIFSGFPNSKVSEFELPSGLAVTKSDAGFIELKLPQFDYPLRVLLTPFANEERLRKYLGDNHREVALRETVSQTWHTNLKNQPDLDKSVNILVSHLLFVSDKNAKIQEDEGERPIFVGTASAFFPEDVPDGLQYVALGHLHRFHFVAKSRVPIVYSGSPLAYSFNEHNQDKYVVIVDVEPNKRAEIKEVPLKTAKKLLKIVAENPSHAIEELLKSPDALIQLSMKTETYLDGTITQPIYDSHKGIVGNIIPLISENTEGGTASRIVDFNDIEKMFLDYYKFKRREEPSEALLNIFKEIMQ